MKKLTERQQLVFDFIANYFQREGMPPTVREIADGLEFKSPNSVQEHLRLIEKKGWVELRRGIARGIFPVSPVAVQVESSRTREIAVRRLPIIGSVAAGTPITAEENIENEIAVDAELFGGDDLFTFRVAGDSMIEAGIHNGDFVIVRKQNIARDGDKIVALINGDTTLKTYYNKGDHVILRPENERLRDIIVDEHSHFSIAGKMVGLIRRC